MELLHLTGLITAADLSLQRLYYQVRGDRENDTSVVFVAIDEHTADAWGAPPWEWERYVQLIEAIDRGKPRAIAVLEPGPRLLAEEASRAAPAALESIEHLVLPPTVSGLSQPKIVTETHGVVRSIYIRDLAGKNTSARALEEAGFAIPMGDTLLVNFAGSPQRFPTVPAHRVADGEVPSSTFENRVAVIGLRGELFAPQVPTPVGPMSPAEVHAHALLSQSQGATWAELSGWTHRLITLLLVIVALIGLPRLEHRRGAIAVGVTALLVVIVDYLLFANGTVLVGASAHVVGLALGFGATIAMERRLAREELQTLVRAVGSKLSLYAQEQHAGDTDEEFFERFAKASQTYADYESTAFFITPPNTWRLRTATLVDMTSEQIFERRRDIRREPFKEAYVNRRPTWSTRQFMAKDLELKTLVVPLVTLRRLMGVWIINYAANANVSDSELEILEGLAAQLAMTLERRRLARFTSMDQEGLALADGRLMGDVAHARRLADSLSGDREQLSHLVEWLPVGVLVASIWGEIELVNEQMRRFVASFGVEDARRIDLVSLLNRISGDAPEVARKVLRQQILDREPVELSGKTEGAASSVSSYQIKLVPMSASASTGKLPSGFILTSNVVAETEIAEVAWRWKLNDAREGQRIDVRSILRRVVDELNRHTDRPMKLELPERAPRARFDEDAFSEAVTRIMAEVVSAGSQTGEPGSVSVTYDDDAVIIRFVDPTLTLPAGVSVPGFDRARALLAEWNGEMDQSSDLEHGTSVVVRIPKES